MSTTSRHNQTQLAVLGALSVAPASGYAVREGIRDVLGDFWSESFGQIYPTIAELERGRMIRRREGTRAGASVFELTKRGHDRLVALLREPIQPQKPRNGLMLRLFFGRHLGPDECRELIAAAKAQAQAQLTRLGEERAAVERETEHAADMPYWLVTISAGEHIARAMIAWADEALVSLETQKDKR